MQWLVGGVGLAFVLVFLTPAPTQGQDVDTLVSQLASPNPTQRATAACQLGRMPAESVRRAQAGLMELLTDGTEVSGPLCRGVGRGSRARFDESWPGREAAIALEALGTEVLEPLVDVLRGPDPVGRENAALALGLIEDASALEALSSAVGQDTTARVRARAAWALGMIESDDGVAVLTAALSDSSAKVREQAAWGLGMIESSDGVQPLLEALRDHSDDVREQAAWGLGMIESSSAVGGLIAVLSEDSSPEVRKQAAWALGMIEDPAAAEALMDALADEDAGVQEEAMWALGMVMRQGRFETIDRGALADAIRQVLRRDQ